MARKKQIQVIEIDVLTKGLANSVKDFESMAENIGELGDKSKKVLKEIGKAQKLIEEFGEEMPVSEAKKLQEILGRISRYSDDIANLKMAKVVTEEDTKKIKKYEESIKRLRENIEKLSNVQSKSDYKKSIIKDLQNQKWISKTKDGKTERRNLESIKGWKTEKDLETIANDPSRKLNDQRAALLALEKLRTETEKYGQTLKDNNEKIKEYRQQLDLEEKEYGELLNSIRTVTDEEKVRGETLSMFADKQSDSIGKVIKANQELGNNVITTSKGINKEVTSLGGAVKALFSWTAAWNIGKRILREAINTITEMDESLNGMAMVTGKSREEIDKLIPRIQTLAKDTSTAMTEIAGLITEYTKQGRTLQESFVLAEETAKAAKIAGISAAESIQYMTSAINGFNLAATDATRVSDVFANIAAISATDYEQLAISLSKVSAQANLAGMSMEYTTALLAKGIETTQEAPESIGTALKTIIARMRELTDYGKTLEDGASVNKVENALAAAGIELRNVNGEFRDLEEIFSELGPKWDHLNTMQQQAIAQAVAGTRQQSRFVAIMQDWERTQELAAEAQDSAGASAAQYAVYAQSMEAAMTNMKTSWQEFIQSLTSSKAIIGGVNLITKLLEDVTNILEGGGELTKTLFMSLTAIIAISTTRNKIKQALGIETDKEKLLALETLKIEKDKLETDKISLQNKKAELELQRQITAETLQQKQAELNTANADVVSWQSVLEGHQEMDDIQGIDESPETAHAREQLELQKQKVVALQKEINLKTTSLNSIDQQLLSTKNQEANLNSQSLEAQKKYNEAIAISNHPLAARTELLIKELQVQKDKNDAEIAHLKTLKQTEDVVARIAKLEARSPKLQTRINNLEKQKNKILTKGSGIVGTVSRTLSTTIQSNLQGVLSKLGPIGQLLGSGLDSIINWGAELLAQIPLMTAQFGLMFKMKSLKKEYAKMSDADLIKQAGILATKIGEAKTEEEITEEQKKQSKLMLQELATRGLVTGQQVTELLGEKAIGKAKDTNNAKTVAGIGAETTKALVTSASSAASIPVVGWVIAAALLAAAGIGVAAAIASANRDSTKENKIQESQNEMYSKKRQNKDLESKREEFVVLLEKDDRTLEEEEQLQTLEEAIQGLDASLENKTGKALLKGMNKLQEENEKLIKEEIQSNYELAISMKDISNSDLGQQAIIDKVDLLQNDYLEMNNNFAFTTDELKNIITKQSNDLATSLGENIKYIGKYSEKGWATMSEEERDSYIKEFSKTSSDFVTDMELFLRKTNDQGKELHSFGEQVHEYIKNIDVYFGDDEFAKQLIEKEYQELSFIANLVNQETELEYKNSVLENIDKLTELGILTTDNIKELANLFNNTDLYTQATSEKAKKTLDQFDKNSSYFFLGYEDNYGNKQQGIYDMLGLDSNNATIEDLLIKIFGVTGAHEDTVENLYLKYLEDEKGVASEAFSVHAPTDLSYVFLDSEQQLEIVDTLMQAYGSGLGSLSYSGISELFEKGTFSTEEMFNNLVNSLTLVNGDNRVDDVYDVFQKSMLVKNYLPYLQKEMDAKYREAVEHKKSGRDEEYRKAMEEYNTKKSQYESMKKSIDDVLKSITNYMSADQMYEVIEKAGDAAKNVIDIREAALAGEGFSIEQLQKLENDIIPTLQAEIENFDASKFIKGLEQGTAESIAQLEQYQQFSAENTKQILQDNIQSHSAEIERLEDALENTSDESEKRSIIASIKNEKLLLSIAEQTAREYERQLDAIKGMNKEERERYNRQNLLVRFENTHNMDELNIDEWKEYANLLDFIANESTTDLAKALRELAKDTSTIKNPIDVKTLMSIIKFEGGVVTLTEAYDDLDEEQKQTIDNALENIEELVAEAYEASKQIEETYEEFLEDQFEKAQEYYDNLIDAQNRLIDYYKNKLQEEQEELQKSLDKRKEMYEKYYDSLEEQESDEDFEEQQAKLQRAIASLATASDGASLTKQKELLQQLEELEEEQLSTERERRRDNVMATLDNESEIVDEYYDNLLEDNRRLWEDIKRMDTLQIHELMTTYNEEWKNGTDEQRKIIDMENMEIYKQFPELANMSKEEIEAKYEAMKKQFIEDAGFSTTQITDKINKIELDFITMLNNVLAKLEDDDNNNNNNNNYPKPPSRTPIIGEPWQNPFSAREAWRESYAYIYDGWRTIMPYSTGGYVDYTGLAMVHGTPSTPEAFLNASQTAMFADLAANLQAIYSRPSHYTDDYDDSSEVIIENLTIAVDAELTNENVPEIGQSLADALFDGIRRSGYNINTKK